MKQGLWAPFRVRILPPGELPADGELKIARYAFGMELEDVDLEVSTPPIVFVLRAIAQGSVPSRLAVEDMSAQTTSALAVALGVRLSVEICTAAVLYDNIGPSAVEDVHRLVLDAYYGYQQHVSEEESQRRWPREDRILRKLVRFWRKTARNRRAVTCFASLHREYKEMSRLGIDDVSLEYEMFCVIEAECWPYSLGFDYSETVVHIGTGWELQWKRNLRVTIGTVAENRDFMQCVHAKLCQAELEARRKRGLLGSGSRWRLGRGEYLRAPRWGSHLSARRVVQILRSCML